MSSTKIVISGADLYKMRGQAAIAIGALTRLQAGWKEQYWKNKVGTRIWVWQYGIPVKASSSDIDETIKLHEKQVWVGWNWDAPIHKYRRGKNWIANDIRVLKDMLVLIDTAGPDGEVHLSGYNCRSLNSALDLENTETKLKALI